MGGAKRHTGKAASPANAKGHTSGKSGILGVKAFATKKAAAGKKDGRLIGSQKRGMSEEGAKRVAKGIISQSSAFGLSGILDEALEELKDKNITHRSAAQKRAQAMGETKASTAAAMQSIVAAPSTVSLMHQPRGQYSNLAGAATAPPAVPPPTTEQILSGLSGWTL